MITAAQLRAARGLLDWTRSDLAKAANVSPETIKNIEHGTFRPQENTAEAIIRAFAAQDVQFTESEGVKRSHNQITVFKGTEGFKAFLDDVYNVAKTLSSDKNTNKTICVSNVDDRFFIQYINEYAVAHAHRMDLLTPKVSVKIVLRNAAQLMVPGTTYREYRLQEISSDSSVPFYVYGDKLGILIFEESREPQIVVISAAPVAKAYAEQFKILWQNAQALNIRS